MSKPSDSKSKREAGVDRRRFFTMGGSAVVAAAAAPLASGEALADERVAGRSPQGPLQRDGPRQELLSRQPLLMGPRTC